MPPLWKVLGVKPPTSQDKLKQLHSQCQKKKSGSLFLTLCHLVIIYKCYSHQTFVNSSLRICLLDFGFVFWVTSLQGLVGGGWGCLRSIRYFLETWHQAFMSWLFLSSNNILLMCKSPKKFFWVMSFLYCLRKDPTIPCAGLTKVAGCRWKSLSAWLVSASYSAWHFFTDGIF